MKNGLPDNNNWNKFWNKNTKSKFTKISWSKRRIKDVLEKYLKEDMLVLDAGCGSGFYSKYFLDRGCRVYSLDYSQEALEIARRITNNKCTYLKGDLLSDKFCINYKNKFDLIFSDGLFEHFTKKDQSRILKNLCFMKKNSGIITTFVPNKYSLWEVIRPFFMPGIKENPFTLSDINNVISKENLKILECGGLNVLPFSFSPEFLGKYIGMLVFNIVL